MKDRVPYERLLERRDFWCAEASKERDRAEAAEREASELRERIAKLNNDLERAERAAVLGSREIRELRGALRELSVLFSEAQEGDGPAATRARQILRAAVSTGEDADTR